MDKKKDLADKLRSSGLRPTKQRLRLAEYLFNRSKTFHFTVENLDKVINKKGSDEKVALATIYNTVHAFEKAGHLKEILLKEGRSYFDTNITSHHHFYDEENNMLIDCDADDIDTINIKKNIPGKKINSVEVLIKVASDNHNQN